MALAESIPLYTTPEPLGLLIPRSLWGMLNVSYVTRPVLENLWLTVAAGAATPNLLNISLAQPVVQISLYQALTSIVVATYFVRAGSDIAAAVRARQWSRLFFIECSCAKSNTRG